MVILGGGGVCFERGTPVESAARFWEEVGGRVEGRAGGRQECSQGTREEVELRGGPLLGLLE